MKVIKSTGYPEFKPFVLSIEIENMDEFFYLWNLFDEHQEKVLSRSTYRFDTNKVKKSAVWSELERRRIELGYSVR